MQSYLEAEELWDAVEPTKKADGTFEAVDAAKNRKARGKIISGLDPSIYVHVQGTKTAKEAWDELEKTYEDHGLTRRWGLLHKLMTTNLANSVSMEAYVTRMVATANQLAGVGFPINEEWLGMLLLAGLPESYKPMVMALQNSGEAITGDLIKTKLLQEDHEPAEDGKPAFAIKRRPGNKQDHHGNKSKGPKCHSCHKFGHIARNCPEDSSSSSSESSYKDSRKLGRAFGAALKTANEFESEEWFFDSGASRHLTRTKSLLYDVHRASGRMIAANKGGMKVVAKGTAVLNTTCGEEINVYDVQFTPGLAANLLSVSKIVDKGYTVVFRRNGCEVLDEEGACVATGSRTNGLFKLEQENPKVLTCRSRRRRRKVVTNGPRCSVVRLDFMDAAKKDDKTSVISPAFQPRNSLKPPVSPAWSRSGRGHACLYKEVANKGSGQRARMSDEPEQALGNSNGWGCAMQEEYNARNSNGNWEMTNHPAGRKADSDVVYLRGRVHDPVYHRNCVMGAPASSDQTGREEYQRSRQTRRDTRSWRCQCQD